jgi:hypothetical protein
MKISSDPPVAPSRRDLVEIRQLADELKRGFQEVSERITDARDQIAARDRGPAKSGIGDRSADPLIAFVHIPKTAGGTVTSMFARAYSSASVQKAGNYMRGPENAAKKVAKRPGGWESWQRRGGRLAVGHVPYRLFRDHLPTTTRYMTFLREPVDRVLSHYYRHVHRTPAHSGRGEPSTASQGARPKADSIEQALVDMQLARLNNLATRFLCGHRSPLGDLPGSPLDEAKANLREFAFVGIQERFEESLVLLQRTLGLDLVPAADRHVSSDRPTVEEVPDEQRALIAEYNQFDLELYAFGEELFEDALGAVADQEFATEVETLRAASAAANEAQERELQAACDWLDRELPAGSKKPVPALGAAAEAAGISELMLKRAARSLSVNKELEPDGQPSWARPQEAHAEPA